MVGPPSSWCSSEDQGDSLEGLSSGLFARSDVINPGAFPIAVIRHPAEPEIATFLGIPAGTA